VVKGRRRSIGGSHFLNKVTFLRGGTSDLKEETDIGKQSPAKKIVGGGQPTSPELNLSLHLRDAEKAESKDRA